MFHNPPYSVLIVDDHPLFCEGLKATLSSLPEIKIVGTAADGEEAIQKASDLEPNIVLLDIGLPKKTGFEVIIELKKMHLSSKIIALTMHNLEEYMNRFMELGGDGYVIKDAHPDEITKALFSVMKNDHYVSASAHVKAASQEALQITPPISVLSPREIEVLARIASNSRNKEIASMLLISVRTVEKHRARIMKKLKIDNVAGLTRYAVKAGIV